MSAEEQKSVSCDVNERKSDREKDKINTEADMEIQNEKDLYI